MALDHLRGKVAFVKEDHPFRDDLMQLVYEDLAEDLAAPPVRFGVALRGVERLF